MAERVRRTKDQIIADLDKKIADHNDAIKKIEETVAPKIAKHKDIIAKLEAKKEAALNPAPRTYARKKRMKSVMDKAKELGL